MRATSGRHHGATSILTVLAVAPLLITAAWTGGAGPAGAAGHGTAAPTSIVQLGDSIASGEGTLYDFTFDNGTGKWSGPGNPDPGWLAPYPACHESPDAYGQLLATAYAGAAFTQLACTGATFGHGVAGPWSTAVPAEFGDWATRSGLNVRYSAAKPDLVLVTLGADDVQFVNIVSQCIESNYNPLYRRTQCTAAQPGGPDNVITADLTSYLPTLEATLQSLAAWIVARGRAEGLVPKIVFTTYPDPLPSDAPAGKDNFCPDTWLLENDQLDYLSSLVPVLDHAITSAIDGYAADTGNKGIAVVNLAGVDAGHQWCAKAGGQYVQPWAYGLSIYHHYTDLYDPNPAAFHPTPAGQRAIEDAVKPVVDRLFAAG